MLDGDTLKVNPAEVVRLLRRHFATYVHSLLDGVTEHEGLRENFRRRYRVEGVA
jgi:hypothetical protein